MRRTSADMPERWVFLPINDSNVRVVSFFGLMESTPTKAPFSAPWTFDSWLAAADGDASGFWFASLFAELSPIPFVWGQYAAAARLDAQAAKEYFASGGQQRSSNLGYVGSAFAWGGGRLADGWPAVLDEDAYRRVRTSEVETLLVGGELDFSTPPQVATEELLPYLSNSHEIVLPGFGHTATFWADQPEAGTHLVNTFFDSGQVDDSLYRPQQVDFTPTGTLPALAKRVAGAMVGLALLTVLSLPWMARRVHERGRFGRTGGVILRTVYPVVLGLGGRSLGVVVVDTTLPGVPLGTALLVALSAGVPIGLGIYRAWVNRDWTTSTKTAGLAAAAGGALVGAWLGFTATAGLVAVVIAVVGAAVGANLALVALDITRDLSSRSRAAVDRRLTSSPSREAGSRRGSEDVQHLELQLAGTGGRHAARLRGAVRR
jgi:hypothetical protein